MLWGWRCRAAGWAASAALAFAAVAERVFVVYASFGSAAEPQIIGVASSATRAEELADRYAEEDRCGWRWPNRLGWDSARPVHARSMCAVTPSR